MTALQQHDSLQPHPALNWPIEVTEPASIGDRLIERKKTPELVRIFWAETEQSEPYHWEWLCGTDAPGNVHFTLESTRGFMHELLRDAGFYEDPRNADPISFNGEEPRWYPPVPRPCVGDPRMDPTVLEEGCMLPWMSPPFFWSIDDEETGLDGLSSSFARNMALMHDLGSGPAVNDQVTEQEQS